MSRFAIRFPYFIIVLCLVTCVLGLTSIVRMPVDLFPPINIPVVVVATFFNGMPPEQMENDITGRFERFFTLGSGIEHMESRSLPGMSIIKIYFHPGTNPDSAVTTIANLAMADLRRLPPGTLPPVVLKMDPSGLPVCLVTLKGKGLNETQLRDYGQFAVRDQLANVPGASVPPPFGGRYRQIMVYVDPYKLEANQLSVMDVVRTINDANLILPAGDVKMGPFDYNIYTNSQLNDIADINNVPLKMVNNAPVLVRDVGYAKDAQEIQYNIVRVDGQHSVYLPVFKAGSDSNTIAIVDGVRKITQHLLDVPKSLVTNVVFDQSQFVKTAIKDLLDEGGIGLVLTGLMILLFLGNIRATFAVFLSIPLSALAAFTVLFFGGGSINSMILGGLALAFSRLIDNSVVVLENIFRHMELGESPGIASERGGSEVALPVLAATITTAIVFFPVTFLYGVSQFLFSALALAVVLSLFASYLVAMTVVPLFCANWIPQENVHHHEESDGKTRLSWGRRFNRWFTGVFTRFLDGYERFLGIALVRPWMTVAVLLGLFVLSLGLTPWVGIAYFPRTDPGQFVINIKGITGLRLEDTEVAVKKVEDIVHREVDPHDLQLIVSNIGNTPGFSSIYNSNSATHTAFVQVSLKSNHKVGSYAYMDRIRKIIQTEAPEVSTYFQSGGLVDAVLNLGLPAPLDVQVSGTNLEEDHAVAQEIADQAKRIPGVNDILIPQDIDAPSVQVNINRVQASKLGLNQKEVVDNIITALTSNAMIAPSYWIDPKTGNDYFLTVQYPEGTVQNTSELSSIPLRGLNELNPTRLNMVATVSKILAPTEVDHYQIRRIIDVFITSKTEDLRIIAPAVQKIMDQVHKPEGLEIALRGSVQAMYASFKSFGVGLLLSVLLVYLVLVAQFRSFIDPFLILLAIPPGLLGVIVTLLFSGTTLNVMSLMGIVMMVGIVVSNSILIVEFTHRLMENENLAVNVAASRACRIRLRPILMTSLATIFGLIPMALKLEPGAGAYASLARAIIGGLGISVVFTVFLVPAAFTIVYRSRDQRRTKIAMEPVEDPSI